jgi:beta-N-acetylhexosaminidase
MTHTANNSMNAGRLIMIRIPGTELDAETANYLRSNGIRAVCLFRQNMVDAPQLSRLTADLRAVMGEHALIALDQEGGAVVRATWLPNPPAAMALGAGDDAALAREVGAACARGVKSLGFNWNFAPVLDLNNNAANPVIAERSFGSDPERASRLALAWMDGSLEQGVACCVKHFPGHGDTHVDSHRDLPTVSKSRAELEALELVSFRLACASAPAMMTAHIVYPALDAEFPATLSRRILTDLLRVQWGYQGVFITDGMDMHAIAGRYGIGNAAVRALLAGTDMVMALGDRTTQLETLASITTALDDGSLTAADIAPKLARLDALARAYPCAVGEYAAADEARDAQTMARAWRAGLTARGAPSAPAKGSKVRLVVRADVVSDGVSEAGVAAATVTALLARLYDVDTVTFADADTFDWSALPADGRSVILASTSRLRYGPMARAHWRPDLHLALWSPFQTLDIDAPALISYGFSPAALEAVHDWLCGVLPARGVCPVAGFDASSAPPSP